MREELAGNEGRKRRKRARRQRSKIEFGGEGERRREEINFDEISLANNSVPHLE
jgi:hypothetical protein